MITSSIFTSAELFRPSIAIVGKSVSDNAPKSISFFKRIKKSGGKLSGHFLSKIN